MIRGVDLSTLAEVEACGGRFFDGGREGDAMAILRDNGANLVRLRVWNDPFSEDGEPYGAGGNDLAASLALAARANALGMDWMADFHYSDFWADPGKQRVPKAWRGLDLAGLADAVYAFTRDCLSEALRRGLPPKYVAVGNEITNGLLWPLGRAPRFEAIAALVGAGLRAVREALPGARTLLHLDAGGDRARCRDWFERYFAAGGADFDVIGLSYYPFWHGPMEGLAANLRDLTERWDRDTMIVETAMGFTLEDYGAYERLPEGARKGMAARAELAARTGRPMTPEGQRDFLRELAATIRGAPGGRCLGFVYWEPAWLPVPGSGWATRAALDYIGEPGPGGNEWANLCLFDYDGRALPALKALAML